MAAKRCAARPIRSRDFHASPETRTPGQILAHIGDLLDWALSAARGQQQWHESAPLPWPEEVRRFFAALEAFDAYLASENPLHAPAEKLLQAPIADALTHVGQIAMLRRLAGSFRCVRRTITSRKSPPGPWAPISPRQCTSFSNYVFARRRSVKFSDSDQESRFHGCGRDNAGTRDRG